MKLWSMVLIALGTLPLAAVAEEVVYLQRTSGDNPAPARYELTTRPVVPRRDVIEVLAKDVADLEKMAAGGSGSFYIARTTPSALPERYEVREYAPGVGYMQSMAGGGGPSSRRAESTSRPGQWQPKGTMLDQPARR